jgi:hypothetical protein
MKVKDLITELLKRNTLDDEVIVAYWDKGYFIDADLATDEIERVWDKFIPDADETVMAHLEFAQTGYDLIACLEELIEEKEEND